MLRGDSLVASKGKLFQLELHTNAAGKATASVPCGYLDFFATAGGFSPIAEKLSIRKDSQEITIALKVHRMIVH